MRKEKIIWHGEKVHNFNFFFFFTFSEFKEQIESVTDVKNDCIDSSVQMLGMCYLVRRVAR